LAAAAGEATALALLIFGAITLLSVEHCTSIAIVREETEFELGEQAGDPLFASEETLLKRVESEWGHGSVSRTHVADVGYVME
jgi:hypothetical protein